MKKLVVTALTLALAFVVLGCSDTEVEKKAAGGEQTVPADTTDLMKRVEELQKEGIHEELASVVDHFKKEGLTVDDIDLKAYDMIGAIGGIGLAIEGTGGLELYLFDPSTADEALAANLANAQQTGSFLLPGSEMELSVLMNDNIMLMGLERGKYYQHPAKDRIAEVFSKY